MFNSYQFMQHYEDKYGINSYTPYKIKLNSIFYTQITSMSKNLHSVSIDKTNSIQIDLQLNLLNTWTKFKVPDYYQNIVLAHVDDLEPAKAQEAIKKQIKLTLEKKSAYFQLQKYHEQRHSILKTLNAKMKNKQQIKSIAELGELCQHLKDLREANLKAGEYILKIHHMFRCNNQTGAQKQLQYYDLMFDKLDRDNSFLKTSVLSNYIVFDQGFDPFLMSAYEHVHRTQMKNLTEPIKDFYTLNISYAYKLMKTKNNILELRSNAHMNIPQDINQKSLAYSQLYDQRSPKNSGKNVNPIKSNREPIDQYGDADKKTIKEQYKKIKPIQVFPSSIPRSKNTAYTEPRDHNQSFTHTEPTEPIKLKFQKIQDDRSRSSSFRFEPVFDGNSRYSEKQSLRQQREVQKVGTGIIRKNSVRNEYDINNDNKIQVKYKKSLPQKTGKNDGNQDSEQKSRYNNTERLTPIKKRFKTQGNDDPFIQINQTQKKSQDLYQKSDVQPVVHQSRIKLPQLEQKKISQRWATVDNKPKKESRIKKIQNYNPIKKDEFSIKETEQKDKKYDYNPLSTLRNTQQYTLVSEQFQKNNQSGLMYEAPIAKYSIKQNKKSQPKRDEDNDKNYNQAQRNYHERKGSGRRKLVDQDCQTVELKKSQNQGENQIKQKGKYRQQSGSYNNLPPENRQKPSNQYNTNSQHPKQSYNNNQNQVYLREKIQPEPYHRNSSPQNNQRQYKNNQNQNEYYQRQRRQQQHEPYNNDQRQYKNQNDQMPKRESQYPYQPKNNQRIQNQSNYQHQRQPYNNNNQNYHRRQPEPEPVHNNQPPPSSGRYGVITKKPERSPYRQQPPKQQSQPNQQSYQQPRRNNYREEERYYNPPSNQPQPQSYYQPSQSHQRQYNQPYQQSSYKQAPRQQQRSPHQQQYQQQYQQQPPKTNSKVYSQPEEPQPYQEIPNKQTSTARNYKQPQKYTPPPSSPSQFPQEKYQENNRRQPQPLQNNHKYQQKVPEARQNPQVRSSKYDDRGQSQQNPPRESQQHAPKQSPQKQKYAPVQAQKSAPRESQQSQIPRESQKSVPRQTQQSVPKQGQQPAPRESQQSNIPKQSQQSNVPRESQQSGAKVGQNNVSRQNQQSAPRQSQQSTSKNNQQKPVVKPVQQAPVQSKNQSEQDDESEQQSKVQEKKQEEKQQSDQNEEQSEQEDSQQESQQESSQAQPSERPVPSAKARNFELKMKQVPTNQSKFQQNSQNPPKVGQQKQSPESPPKDKRQVRMKICKQNLPQVISLLQKINIANNYKTNFDRKKIIDWVSNNQTYCIYFYLNQQLAILTLCSPVPDIGMMIKLWAPVQGQVTEKITNTLFKKYVQLIQKSTSAEKILYSGKDMLQLKDAEFVKISQNNYERTRKLPMKEDDNEFKMFLYIECSNVKFDNMGDLSLLYSNQIEAFTEQNSYAIEFMGKANNEVIPKKLQPFVSFSSKVQNFKKVNEILTEQDFDNYQASEMFIKDIDLIRFYLNCPLRSAFVAHGGYLKLTGNVLYEKNGKYLISMGVVKNNGFMYFGKGIELKEIFELSKNKPKKTVKFSVIMFNKKLYGAMAKYPHGCYGCWQINLVWEDECPGKIIHNMKEPYSFTEEGFSVMIELSGEKVFGFKVGKEDSIL